MDAGENARPPLCPTTPGDVKAFGRHWWRDGEIVRVSYLADWQTMIVFIFGDPSDEPVDPRDRWQGPVREQPPKEAP